MGAADVGSDSIPVSNLGWKNGKYGVLEETLPQDKAVFSLEIQCPLS